MLNNKNMFTYKIRKINSQKENDNIIPNDPSNIFEFTSKKPKLINFDELFKSKRTEKTSLRDKENDRRVNTGNNKKKSAHRRVENKKKINFDQILRKEKVKDMDTSKKRQQIREKEVVNTCELVNNEVKKFKKDLSSINTLLYEFCIENKSDKYTSELLEMLEEDSCLLEDPNTEEEIRLLNEKINAIDLEKEKWSEMKNEVLSKNIIREDIFDNRVKLKEGCPINDRTEIQMNDYNFYDKLIFLKDNIKLFANNLNIRLSEIECKIYNMMKEDNELDSMVLLKAITKYN